MLEERAAQWKDDYIRQGVLMGLAEGEAKGRAKGFGLALQNLLEIRFGRLPSDVSASLAGVSDMDALRELTLSAYRAASLQAFVEQLKKHGATLR